MSTSDSIPPPDDLVARATDAMRRVPVPDGPPPETIARTLAALREAEAAPVVIPRTRRRIMFTILKMAGAVLATAAGVAYFAVFPPAAAKSEFVEAAAKLRDCADPVVTPDPDPDDRRPARDDKRPAPLQGPGAGAH